MVYGQLSELTAKRCSPKNNNVLFIRCKREHCKNKTLPPHSIGDGSNSLGVTTFNSQGISQRPVFFVVDIWAFYISGGIVSKFFALPRNPEGWSTPKQFFWICLTSIGCNFCSCDNPGCHAASWNISHAGKLTVRNRGSYLPIAHRRL